MSALVISLHDLRARRAGVVDTRTEFERLKAEARAEVFAEVAAEAFHKGMRAAMESMHVTPPAMLPARPLALVQLGGCA